MERVDCRGGLGTNLVFDGEGSDDVVIPKHVEDGSSFGRPDSSGLFEFRGNGFSVFNHSRPPNGDDFAVDVCAGTESGMGLEVCCGRRFDAGAIGSCEDGFGNGMFGVGFDSGG